MNESAWADMLSLFDSVRNVTWDDWRLPVCLDDLVASLACSTNELEHLFNADGVSAVAPRLFANVQPDWYWLGTETAFVPHTNTAWSFNFATGGQVGSRTHATDAHAWAVRDGDVANPIPNPPPCSYSAQGS